MMDAFPDDSELFSDHEDEYEAMRDAEAIEFLNEPSALFTARNPPGNKTVPPPTLSVEETGGLTDENDENKTPSPADHGIPEPFTSPDQSNRPKRSLQEIFDDVDALLLHGEGSPPPAGGKRSRREHDARGSAATDEQQRVLDAISILRAARKEAEEESAALFGQSSCGKRHFREPVVFRKPPQTSNFVSFRNPYTQKNLYVTLQPEDGPPVVRSRSAHDSSRKNLLEVPYRVLHRMAEKERELRARKRDEREAVTHILEEMTEAAEESNESCLWVDKYRPRGYMDLLSDESTNRTLLHWIRMWDKVVFGKEVLKKTCDPPMPDPSGKGGKFFPRQYGPAITFELDERSRPKQTVALLCGPPGMGKTTLAHTIARHAGYNVVEVNASDDRSPDAFIALLKSATEMRSVLGAQPKPNCLVIDEIDGAQAASINVLVDFIAGKTTGRNRRKKGEEKASFLKRPVICICNDAFVPALKPLKPHSLIVNFPPTTSHRLAQRMLKIVREQKLRADITTLMMLCEKAENDIRSCLSTLEFICSKKQNLDLRMSDVEQAAVGQKDCHKSLFSIWQEVFFIPRSKRKHLGSGLKRNDEFGRENFEPTDLHEDNTTMKARFYNILHIAQSFGDYEKVVQGVYENFLKVPFKDSSMRGVAHGLDRLCLSDRIVTEIHTSQNYSLMGYLNYTIVLFHLLFASYQRPKLEYPHMGFEASVKMTKTRNILESVLRDAHPRLRHATTLQCLVEEILPFLVNILQPSLRPVNVHLYSPREKAELKKVVQTMLDFNVSFHQERQLDGQFAFVLDPNIDEAVRFPGQPRPQLPYTVKQLISRELELERMRRDRDGAAVAVSQAAQQSPSARPQPSKPSELPSHKRQKLEPKKIGDRVEAVHVAKDFFGRPVVNLAPAKTKGPDVLSAPGIWYHFKEGYNNAVRKTIRMKDLVSLK